MIIIIHIKDFCIIFAFLKIEIKLIFLSQSIIIFNQNHFNVFNCIKIKQMRAINSLNQFNGRI